MKAIKTILLVAAIMMIVIGSNGCDNKKNVSSTSLSSSEEVSLEKSRSNDSGKIVLIDFFATWCGPCKAMTPVMEEMEKKYGDRIEFKRVDVDQEPELAQKYNVQAIPTLVFLSADDEVIDIIQGYHNANQMDEIMNEILK